jgi:hypothetical protein
MHNRLIDKEWCYVDIVAADVYSRPRLTASPSIGYLHMIALQHRLAINLSLPMFVLDIPAENSLHLMLGQCSRPLAKLQPLRVVNDREFH